MKLLYVYDALCGWCFGFSPVMQTLLAEKGESISVEVISGGLRIDDAVGTIDEVAPYIRHAYQDVEKAAGVRFGKAFVEGPLARGDMRLNSLPPAKALAVFREKFPEQALAFASVLHKIIYVDGHAPENEAVYAQYAANFGYDESAFQEAMQSPAAEVMAREDFKRARALGVRAYPALLREKDGRWESVLNGFVPYPRLLEMLGI